MMERIEELPAVLEKLEVPYYMGHSERGPYILAHVPWRKDTEPSLIAHFKGDRWVWYDAAEGTGGTTLSLVIRATGLGKKEALKFIQSAGRPSGICRLSFPRKPKVRVSEIYDPDERALKIWGVERFPPFIKLGVVERLRTVEKIDKNGEKIRLSHYRRESLPYLVMLDEELKTPVYIRHIIPDNGRKLSLAEVRPRIYRGEERILVVVEGLTDALAAHSLYPECSIMVLGGAGLARRAAGLEEFEGVVCATDSDRAGEEAAEVIKRKCDERGIPFFRLRPENKDLMEDLRCRLG